MAAVLMHASKDTVNVIEERDADAWQYDAELAQVREQHYGAVLPVSTELLPGSVGPVQLASNDAASPQAPSVSKCGLTLRGIFSGPPPGVKQGICPVAFTTEPPPADPLESLSLRSFHCTKSAPVNRRDAAGSTANAAATTGEVHSSRSKLVRPEQVLSRAMETGDALGGGGAGRAQLSP